MPLGLRLPRPLTSWRDLGRGHRLWLLQAPLACCALEVHAGAQAEAGWADVAVERFATEPADADILVVAGTVTYAIAAAIREIHEAMSPPAYVVSFGACSNSGGPYWDSYAVVPGVDSIVPVDVYVPGCPPRPEALVHGLAQLRAVMDRGRP